MGERVPRRVVTGHDENGRSVFLSDGPAPQVQDMSLSQMKVFTSTLNRVMTTGIEPA